MPRPRNDELRDRLQARYLELLPELILKRLVITRLAEEFKLNEHTIRYYVHDPKQVAKRIMTDHLRNKVALMSLAEIKAFATRTGRSWHYLYQVSLAAKRPADAATAKARAEEIRLRGFINFASTADLQACDMTMKDVRSASRMLQQKFGITLSAPNFLVHPKGDKAVALKYADQVFVVRSPISFLQANAPRIGANWQPYDPTKSWFDELGG